MDSELPLYEAATLQSLISESLAQRSFTLVLLGAFAVTALLLASVGIFGVISYLVAQRSSEFGIRMALGASRSQIANLVLSRGAMIAVMGCLCGLALSAFASRLLLTSLYRTDWYDPVMLCLVTLLLFSLSCSPHGCRPVEQPLPTLCALYATNSANPRVFPSLFL